MSLTPILEKLSPTKNELLRLLSQEVDDDMLREIAEADYGMEVDLHFEGLMKIRNGKPGLDELNWEPREVLQLTSWLEPNNADKECDQGERGHLKRAFCCAALMSEIHKPANEYVHYFGSNNHLIQLLCSLNSLGHLYEDACIRFISWILFQENPQIDEPLFFQLALLYLNLKYPNKISEKELLIIATTLITEEKIYRDNKENSFPRDNQTWLLGTTYYNQKHYKWVWLAEEIEKFSKSIQDLEVRQSILLISRLIAGDEHFQTSIKQCPCCDYYSLKKRAAHEICPVCYWEDNGQDFDNIDTVTGPQHGITLKKARSNFISYGAYKSSLKRFAISEDKKKEYYYKKRWI